MLWRGLEVKGYCKCGCIIDEVEFTQYGMCSACKIIMSRKIPDRKNDIAPGANYMDRRRCFSIYFYTDTECYNCPKLKKCEKQNDEEYQKS